MTFDLVRVKDDVKLSKATMKMGKGDDTVCFGKGVTFKGTSTVGDETFTYKDIKKGVEIPGVRVELA